MSAPSLVVGIAQTREKGRRKRTQRLETLSRMAFEKKGFAVHNFVRCSFFFLLCGSRSSFPQRRKCAFLRRLTSPFVSRNKQMMSKKVHLLARLCVVSTNFGYFLLAHELLFKLIDIGPGRRWFLSTSILFFCVGIERTVVTDFFHRPGDRAAFPA